MTLALLPGAVITRVRTQCPVFVNRVAGTAGEAEVSEQYDFPVPHAFFMPGGVEPAGETMISALDQEVTVRFRIMIAVDNTTDLRGQAGAAGLLTAAASVMQALMGWTPAPNFSPVLSDGLEDSFDNNRRHLWGSLTFSTTAMLSDL